MSETIVDFIEKVMYKGYHIDIGPHARRLGFYCVIYKQGEFDECPEWDQTGHGTTIYGAVTNAWRLLQGEEVAAPVKNFKETQ